MNLFRRWLTATPSRHEAVALYEEAKGTRAAGLDALKPMLAQHFVGERTIVGSGGYEKAASIIRTSLPRSKKTRSGDLAELLATEYYSAETPFSVPIKKLRWKDDRDV